MKKNILIVLLIIIIGFLGFIAFKPKEVATISPSYSVTPSGKNADVDDQNPKDYQQVTTTINNQSNSSSNNKAPCETMGCNQARQDEEEVAATITKNNWGISFVKPSKWKASDSGNEILLKNISENAGDQITIDYISSKTITDNDAKFGSINYSYDDNNKQWVETDNEEGEGITPHATPVAAVPVAYTVDNLPIFRGTARWLTYVIPLSHSTFLKLNISGSGYMDPLKDLVKTIKKI